MTGHRSSESPVQPAWSIDRFVRSAYESIRELLTLMLVGSASVIVALQQEHWWLAAAALSLGAVGVGSSVWQLGTRDERVFRWHRLVLWFVPLTVLFLLILFITD